LFVVVKERVTRIAASVSDSPSAADGKQEIIISLPLRVT